MQYLLHIVNLYFSLKQFSLTKVQHFNQKFVLCCELQVEVRLDAEKDFVPEDKARIRKDLKMFLQPIREKLIEFEKQLKDR